MYVKVYVDKIAEEVNHPWTVVVGSFHYNYTFFVLLAFF